MRRLTLAALLALLALAAPAVPGAWACPADPAAFRADFDRRLTAFRAEAGLPPLRRDPALENVAQDWARRLSAEGRYSHLDAQGNGPEARLTAAGRPWRAAAENLAKGGIETPASLLKLWAGSPGHRRNLLWRALGAYGLGIGCEGETVFAQVLAD